MMKKILPFLLLLLFACQHNTVVPGQKSIVIKPLKISSNRYQITLGLYSTINCTNDYFFKNRADEFNQSIKHHLSSHILFKVIDLNETKSSYGCDIVLRIDADILASTKHSVDAPVKGHPVDLVYQWNSTLFDPKTERIFSRKKYPKFTHSFRKSYWIDDETISKKEAALYCENSFQNQLTAFLNSYQDWDKNIKKVAPQIEETFQERF